MLKILTSGSIRTSTRLSILRCYIFSAFYYGCETWTLNKSISKIDAFEMWASRKMLRIPWTRKMRNEDVLVVLNINTKELVTIIMKRKTMYFGHLLDGQRARGRPRTLWMVNIKEWTGRSYEQCNRRSADRVKWRIIYGIQPSTRRWNLMMMMENFSNSRPSCHLAGTPSCIQSVQLAKGYLFIFYNFTY